MRKTAKSLIVLLLAAIVTYPIAVNSKELDIRLERQNNAVWCWGSTIAMVVEYIQRFDVKTCEVLSEFDARLNGRGMCCGNAMECMRAGQTSEMAAILGDIFDIHGAYLTTALSFQDVKKHIDAGRPLIAALVRPFPMGQSGHVVVISGYELPDRIIVQDPQYGRDVVSHSVLMANWKYGYWQQTFTITSNRSSMPRCRRVQENIRFPVRCYCNPMYGCSTCPGPLISRTRIICGR